MDPESPTSETRGGFRSDQFSGLMLIALAVYVGWENRAYPLGTLQEPGPGYLPLLLAVLLGIIGLFVALWGGRSVPLASIKWSEATRAIVILAACAAATFALERRRPLPVALVALGFSLASFYIIGDVLRVPLPRSPWGF